jgi:hypothetical protein
MQGANESGVVAGCEHGTESARAQYIPMLTLGLLSILIGFKLSKQSRILSDQARH